MPDASPDERIADPVSETSFLQDMREEYAADIDADRANRDAAALDLKFLANEQWDSDVLALRKGRPTLNINRMPQFVRQVTGDIRLNKPAIKVSPVENADKETAEVIEGLVRHIEYQSKASRIYATTADCQVACGMGHMRLTVEWPEDSFEPELVISRIKNPFAVVWDSNISKIDCSDAGHCFVESTMSRKAFDKAFADAAIAGWGGDTPRDLKDWVGRDKVRVVEYWKIIKRPITLYLLANGAVIDDSQGDDSLRIAAEQVGIVRERKSTNSVVVQYLTNGHQLLQKPYVWPGKRIPIVTAWGEEVVLGERTVRHGLIRNAQDSQYLSNYLWSNAVEAIALQPKPKWVANELAIEGREDEWANANISTDSTLVYKGANAPVFTRPPDFPAAFLNMARAAEDAMKATTGIYDAALGQQSNETSGRAIQARDRQGDVSTYVYPDNLVAAIENLAGQIVEMVPFVYDAPRQVRILGEDMQAQVLKVNQNPGVNPITGEPGKMIDLKAGKYDVVVQTGPGFTTRRQEAAEAMMEFARIFPPAAPLLMDLVAKNQDWPNRDEFLQRLESLLPNPNKPPPPPPPPNPKDIASAEKLDAETMGQKLENVQRAMSMGLDPSTISAPPPAPEQPPGGPPVPSVGQMNGPMGPQPGAPDAPQGQSVPQGAPPQGM